MRLALLAAALVLPLSCLAASPPPPDLVFTVCKADRPDDCREERVAIDDERECRGYEAQFRIAQWLDLHPKLTFGGAYRCGPAERGA